MTKIQQWLSKRGVLVAIVAPLFPNVIGSVFNIWYNFANIKPLLSEPQMSRFLNAVTIYNLIVYPTLIVSVVLWSRSISRTHQRLLRGDDVELTELSAAQRKVINLPWALVTISCLGWFLCIPVFLAAMYWGPGELDPHVLIHLPISFTIAGMIAVTQSLFVAELCSVRLLYPAFFPSGGAAKTEGGYTLGLVGKGLIWALSAVVCPVISLFLLLIVPEATRDAEFVPFALAVSAVSILFGLVSAVLIGKLVTEPVASLREAAERVGQGDLNARVELSRSDDFGPLIDSFNSMVSGLNEKEQLQATFGRHVGEQAAREILAQEFELGGVEKVITVMFVDLRNYTARSSDLSPHEVVQMLNLFLSDMVEIVENHHGMVNKFLGDGFMALFGAGQFTTGHAELAVRAGQKMLDQMEAINRKLDMDHGAELAIGVGIHTGPAIVGSIGSIRRLEYTAIGDTVNVASRIESLTKALGEPLLFTADTCVFLERGLAVQELPPQQVKGKPEPIEVFTLG